MKLGHLTWPEVQELDRERTVVILPTGSLEQHGHHLPLLTDTLMATAFADAVEKVLPEIALITPTVWQGASTHHLPFSGTISANTQGYREAIRATVDSLRPHGFRKFYILNGHGGNNDPNSVALRELKAEHPELMVAAAGYYQGLTPEFWESVLTGPLKKIAHACEAETSLMLHAYPHLVRQDKLRDDGLYPHHTVVGLVNHFDEITDAGSFGYATQATAEKGKVLFEAITDWIVGQIQALSDGIVFEAPGE